jgi:DNA-cytosine methyltransferase
MIKHGSLFSGIGGFDLAAEWAGWENRFYCELDPFCRKVLSHYWPLAKQYENIKTTDFKRWAGKIDVLSGGFPCQPYSTAGQRKGKNDERHLWPEMLRAVREIKPSWVVGENVRGLLSWNEGVVFDEVQTDLEGEGYQVVPFLLPACGINAPHQRYRVWFVAHAKGNRNNRTPRKGSQALGGSVGNSTEQPQKRGCVWPSPHSKRSGLEGADRVGVEDTIITPEQTSPNPNSNLGSKGGLHQEGAQASMGYSGHAMHSVTQQKTGTTSQLNPRFVAEMMGFPPNWTELPFLSGEKNL